MKLDRYILEIKFLELWNEISPMDLRDFHSLMNEYANMLAAVRDRDKNYEEKKESFLKKISKTPIEFRTLEDVKWLLKDGYSRYNDCAIAFIFLKRGNINNKVIISNPMSFGSITDDHIVDSVIRGKKPKDISYNIGFDKRTKSIADEGLFIGKFDVENELTFMDFSKESYLEKAVYKQNGNLVRVSIRLDKKK